MDDRVPGLVKSLIAKAVVDDGRFLWDSVDREVASLSAGDDEVGVNEAAGLMRLACASRDGRHLVPALVHLNAAGKPELTAAVLRQARLLGELKTVLGANYYGRHGMSNLVTDDLPSFLRSRGCRWFDVYRDTEAGVCFVNDDDAFLLRYLVSALFPDVGAFWNEAVARAEADPLYPEERRALIRKLATGEDPCCPIPPPRRDDVDGRFRAWCRSVGVSIIRTMQEGQDSFRYCAWVYLCRDSDGIVKVFKEKIVRGDGRFPTDSEEELHARAAGCARMPRHFGTVTVDCNLAFMRLEMMYGQSLNDYTHPGKLLDRGSAVYVAREVAKQLSELHGVGIAHLDLRPHNVLIDGRDARLFDLNASRFLDPSGKPLDSIVLDPKFSPPETVLRAESTAASDVFQLGLLLHQMLYGRLPFVTSDDLPHGDAHPECTILKFGLANAVLPYTHNPERDFDDRRLAVIAKMLDKDPARRPAAEEVAESLAGPESRVTGQRGRGRGIGRQKNRVLFPARLGIPHRGHIDYMVRLLDAGFHLTVCLARSYTSTDRDPFPKWIVAKMVARSLMDRGFSPDDFSFSFTPFYGTDEEHLMHYAMLPGREDVVAVASSNPSVRKLFPGLPFIDQRAVFGEEGEEFEDRSWGEIIRRAVKESDFASFCQYVASGVEAIMTFDELRRRYNETPVEFVSGTVCVEVVRDGSVLGRERVRRYDSPESAVVRALAVGGQSVRVIAPYELVTVIDRDGLRAGLRYESAAQDAVGNVTITYSEVSLDQD